MADESNPTPQETIRTILGLTSSGMAQRPSPPEEEEKAIQRMANTLWKLPKRDREKLRVPPKVRERLDQMETES